MYLRSTAPGNRLREAENARRNRAEIVKALSIGQISRRDLIKWGLFTSAGLLAPIRGLNPFVQSAYADSNIPTGTPPSPLFGAQPFTQPLPRFDVLPRNPVTTLNPAPLAESNQTQQPVDPALGGGLGPVEGRPPGPIWAHQRFDEFPPKVAVEVFKRSAAVNKTYNPGVPSSLNSGIDASQPFPPRLHPNFPNQGPLALWTVNGTLPPKLLQARLGEPVLFRDHNRLPFNASQNGGFGSNATTTHHHNGHQGGESDGFTGAYFFPGQFYDYLWPFVLAGHDTINPDASDRRAGSPDGSGGINKVPGDWHETMSSHWFHDHRFGFTSQNVYKGMLGMLNIYSALDRGNEEIDDGVNLRLPSGTAKDWGNLEYDVNLLVEDKALDRDGQLFFDIFDFDGFLGDVMTANLVYKPFFEVERRKYRFRILNGAPSRFVQLQLSDNSEMIQIANDGNLLPAPVSLTRLDQQATGERYDVVIDFSRYRVGEKVWLVNVLEHEDGKGPKEAVSLAEALAGKSDDPCVGKFVEFRIVRDPAKADQSQIPPVLIPNPDLSSVPVSRERTFEFGDGADQDSDNPITSALREAPWGIKTDGGKMLAADFGRISAAPKTGTREIWTLKNGGGGWDHPIHIHFEEGIILARNGSASQVPVWERGRKDMYRLRPSGSVTVSIQFRDFGGVFMEHCHNTVHEDNAMLLRWDVDGKGAPFLRPLPTPIPTPQGVTFISPDDILPTAFDAGAKQSSD